jgi:hypothetical protein
MYGRVTAKNALFEWDCLLAGEYQWVGFVIRLHRSTCDVVGGVRVVLERERSAEVACQGDAGPIGVAWSK